MKIDMSKFLKKGIVFFPIFFAVIAMAGEQDALFQQGVRFYQEENYAEALQAFQQIRDAGHDAGSLYFNMGNCYYKLGDSGRAILFYESAKKLTPGDEDVRFNLGLVNESIVDQIEKQEDFFLIRYWRGFLFLLHKTTFLVLLGALYGAAVLFLIFRLLARNGALRLLSQRLAVTFGVLFLLFGASFIARLHDEKTRVEAVILADKVDVMSAPLAQGGTEVFVLHAGTKVRLDRQRDEWVEIILPDRKVGWVKKDVLEKI
jgi:tetratricopeptide (TPR) repeat protein